MSQIRLKYQFEKLVRLHQDRIYTFARYYLNNEEDAQDVTQEILMRLWHHGMEIPENEVSAWLNRVTRNACFDVLRRRKSYRNNIETDSDKLANLDQESDNLLPDAATEAEEIQAYLQKALDKMKEPLRSIVIMREMQDQSYEQIAEQLNLPLNTVKVYLHRARTQLREALKPLRHESE